MTTRLAVCALIAGSLMSCQSATPTDNTGASAPPQVGAPTSLTPSTAASSANVGAAGVVASNAPVGNAAAAANGSGTAAAMSAMTGSMIGGVAPASGAAGGPPGAQIDPAEEALDKAMPARNSWMGIGGSLEQTFARPDAAIEKSNLSMLGEAWTKMAPGGVTGTPVVYGGNVYWADWVGNVHGNKIVDGTELWVKTYKRGFTSSPFVTDDGVYLSSRDNMVYKLDRATGQEKWATAATDVPIAQMWSSPTVVDGLVIVGIGGKGTSDGGIPYTSTELMKFHGGVIALDAMTGAVRWHWDNTVGKDGMQYGPGVSSWSSPAVDTVRKYVYIGAGNSYYSPASPFSDSILALNYMTTNPKGELVWSKQFTMNDNFTSGSPLGPDSDVGSTPNLYTLGGRDYVSVGDKGGHFYILDRQTGELLSTTPAGNGSSTGGVMAPAAYGDGALYQAANATGTTVVQKIDAKTGKSLWSQTLLGGVNFSAPLLLKDVLLLSTNTGFPSGGLQPSQIIALDRETGNQVPGWSLSVPSQRGGGMSIYHNTLLISFGFVFENSDAESRLMGGVLAAAIGGKPIEPMDMGPVATHAPTYSAIYDEILSPQGCTADRCHGGLGIKVAAKAMGYANLTGDSGTGACAGMKLVVPGQPMQSLLYRKVADAMPPCGARMPLGLQPLKPEELTQIQTWIEMGAPNN